MEEKMKKEEFKDKFLKLSQEIVEEKEELCFGGYHSITDHVKILEHQISDLMDLVNKYLFEE